MGFGAIPEMGLAYKSVLMGLFSLMPSTNFYRTIEICRRHKAEQSHQYAFVSEPHLGDRTESHPSVDSSAESEPHTRRVSSIVPSQLMTLGHQTQHQNCIRRRL